MYQRTLESSRDMVFGRYFTTILCFFINPSLFKVELSHIHMSSPTLKLDLV
jgi:hypothetical protein